MICLDTIFRPFGNGLSKGAAIYGPTAEVDIQRSRPILKIFNNHVVIFFADSKILGKVPAQFLLSADSDAVNDNIIWIRSKFVIIMVDSEASFRIDTQALYKVVRLLRGCCVQVQIGCAVTEESINESLCYVRSRT